MSHEQDGEDKKVLARDDHARLLAKYEPVILGRCIAELRGTSTPTTSPRTSRCASGASSPKASPYAVPFRVGRPQGHRLDAPRPLGRPPDARRAAGGLGSSRSRRRPQGAAAFGKMTGLRFVALDSPELDALIG